MHQFCLQIDGQRICFPIPVLLLEWKPLPDPDPGPLRAIIDNWIEVEGPTPDPWRDMPIVATVEALAELAHTKELRNALTEVVQMQTERITGELPDGAELNLSKAGMAAAAR